MRSFSLISPLSVGGSVRQSVIVIVSGVMLLHIRALRACFSEFLYGLSETFELLKKKKQYTSIYKHFPVNLRFVTFFGHFCWFECFPISIS